MTEDYTRAVLKKVVAQICLAIGWNSVYTTSLEVLVDLLHRYILRITRTAASYCNEFGSTPINLASLDLAFQDLGIKVEDLSEYIQNVESVPCVDTVPKYPIPKESHLNFLKPGSREVVTRPVHVHEHLPPMYPEMEEEENQQSTLSVDIGSTGTSGISPLSSPKGGCVFKRPGEPPSLEHPAVKRARQMLEEEGRPLREISSVMMTTSGFLSPAREGKLPESRTPTLNDPDCYSRSSSTSSYPTVPPEVKGEKKTKKSTKKTSEGQKKMDDKESKKMEDKFKDGNKVEKNSFREEPKVKKLASMKEFAKLKALKSGALKLMSQGNATAMPSMSTLGKVPKVAALKLTTGKPPKGSRTGGKSLKSEKSSAPTLSVQLFKSVNPQEKIKDHNAFVGKLSSEPDKQKLNIFKKISKVKEEKSERVEPFDFTPRDSHGGSTGDETEASRGSREARMAQIDHCIETVIMHSLESDEPCGGGSAADSDSERSVSETPEIRPVVIDLRKPDAPPEKKRKRSKARKEKSKSPKSSPISTPKKIKLENLEPVADVPDVPEVPEMRPPVFPFYTHFTPSPGLIPPPIGHPLFPRFNLPLGKNMPHPAMPNMSLPPALFMHPREEPPRSPPPKLLRPPTPVVAEPPVVEPERSVVKTPPPLALSPPHSKEKGSSEKKSKEHKKDKKDKTKKKKDKKERLKAKAEKRKNREEKKERDKEKMLSKKEKKEKRKEREKEHEKKREKEREEKCEASVPKITFRLGPASPRPPTPDVHPRKITIKPVTKKSCDLEDDESGRREPSPELARISALVTRPPKPKSSSKTGPLSCPEPDDSSVPLPTGSDASPRASFPPLPDSTTKAKKHAGKPYAKVKTKVPKGDSKDAVPAYYHDKEGNKVWICPACGRQDDGSPMIGCDDCDAWYHWVCVGIQVPPDENEDWYCRICIVKKQENYVDKSKKKRKKKQSSPH